MRTCIASCQLLLFLTAALTLAGLTTGCGDDPEPSSNNGTYPDVPDVESELEKDGLWWVESERLYVSLPAMGPDGDIYFGGWDGKLYAVDADGEEKWTVQTGDMIDAAPAVGADGTVIAGSWDKKVYAISADGQEKWTFEADGPIDVSPSVDANGRVYVASDTGTLYRLAADGSVDWDIALPAAPVTSASVFEDDQGLSVFVGTADGALQCISEGQIQASASFDGHPIDDVALDASGSAYVGTSRGHVLKIGRDCSTSFDVNLTYSPSTAPTLDGDGFVYVGTQAEQIFRLDGTHGTEKWAMSTGRRAPFLSSPTLSDDGKLYAGANGLLSITTSGDIEHLSDVGVLSAPLLSQEGGVYAPTETGHMVRFDFDLGSLGASDWPIQHGDAQRSGYLSP